MKGFFMIFTNNRTKIDVGVLGKHVFLFQMLLKGIDFFLFFYDEIMSFQLQIT